MGNMKGIKTKQLAPEDEKNYYQMLSGIKMLMKTNYMTS